MLESFGCLAFPQQPALNLPDRVFGQFGQKEDALRYLVVRQSLARKCDEFRLRQRLARPQDNARGHGFSPYRIPAANHRGLAHSGMLADRCLNLLWRNVAAPSDDYLFLSSGEPVVAVSIAASHVS